MQLRKWTLTKKIDKRVTLSSGYLVVVFIAKPDAKLKWSGAVVLHLNTDHMQDV